MKSPSRETLGYILAILATIVWSGNFIVARGLSSQLTPIEISFWRWLTALVFIMPFTYKSVIQYWPLVKKYPKFFLGGGFIGISLFNTIIYLAGHTTTATNMALLAASSPIFIAILTRVWLKESLTFQQVIGLFIALSGVVILVSKGDFNLLLNLKLAIGDLWMLVSSFLFAFYSMIMRFKPKELPLTTSLSMHIFIGVIGIIPFYLWEFRSPTLYFSWDILGVSLYMGLGASIFSFLCWQQALARIGEVKSGIIYYTIPIYCAIEAALILDEHIELAQVVGGILIVGGILFSTLIKSKLKSST